MSKVKLAAARELIIEKHYDEARSILRVIDHPAAKEWLSKLDEIASATAVDEVSDQMLAQRCDEAEVFKELSWRLKEMTWQSEHRSSKDYERVHALSEHLCKNLSSSNEELVRNSCYLLAQIPSSFYYLVDDPHVDQLAAALKKNQKIEKPNWPEGTSYSERQKSSRIHWYIEQTLLSIYSPQARVAVLSTPFDPEWIVPFHIRKLSRGNFLSHTPHMVREYAVYVEDTFLFSLKILHIFGKYEIKWPDFKTVKEHFDLVELLFELARCDIRKLEFEDENRRLEEDGWQTYLEDIAPYIDDD